MYVPSFETGRPPQPEAGESDPHQRVAPAAGPPAQHGCPSADRATGTTARTTFRHRSLQLEERIPYMMSRRLCCRPVTHLDRRACAAGTAAQCPWAEAGPCAAGASRSDSRAVSPPQVGSLARPNVQRQPFLRRESRPVSISRLLGGGRRYGRCDRGPCSAILCRVSSQTASSELARCSGQSSFSTSCFVFAKRFIPSPASLNSPCARFFEAGVFAAFFAAGPRIATVDL